MRSLTALAVIPIPLVLGAAPTAALDQPISGRRLVIQATAPQKLSFVSRDPAFLFPDIGSADDPGTGSPGGALVELFSPDESPVGFTIAPGVGNPGWRTRTGARPSHRWRNPNAPGGPSAVKAVRLRQDNLLSVLSKLAGLSLVAPPTRIAIRVTTGSLRNCAVFEGASIRTSAAGRFFATDAPAAALADCSDTSLLGLSCANAGFPTCGGGCAPGETCVPDGVTESCHCVSPSTPCGQSNPTCGGVCPAGEECVSSGLNPPFNSCGCIPAGSTPCGNPSAPTCGGTCPTGTTCSGLFPIASIGGPVVCGCMGPGATCINGFAWGGFPAEGFPFGCYPILCSGTYPTCGGSCLDGGVCTAFRIDAGAFTNCICAVPLPCGGGGYECPAGEICHLPTPPVCGPP